jgi:hypothetical protein
VSSKFHFALSMPCETIKLHFCLCKGASTLSSWHAVASWLAMPPGVVDNSPVNLKMMYVIWARPWLLLLTSKKSQWYHATTMPADADDTWRFSWCGKLAVIVEPLYTTSWVWMHPTISTPTQRSSHLHGSCSEFHFLAYVWYLIECVADVTGQVSPYPDSTSYIVKLTFAILGPVLALGLLGALVLFLMRRTHRKRLMSARNMTDLETYYASDDLRVTAAGDSTLRVVECLWLIKC